MHEAISDDDTIVDNHGRHPLRGRLRRKLILFIGVLVWLSLKTLGLVHISIRLRRPLMLEDGLLDQTPPTRFGPNARHDDDDGYRQGSFSQTDRSLRRRSPQTSETDVFTEPKAM